MVRIDVSAETFQRERFPCEYSLSAGRSLTLNDCSRLERTLSCGPAGAIRLRSSKQFSTTKYLDAHIKREVLKSKPKATGPVELFFSFS